MVKKFSRVIEHVLAWQVRRLIKRHHPKVVAVTGSIGKTSTKAAIAHILSSEYRVRADEKSFNTPIGLPLAIFGHDVPGSLINPLAWLIIFFKNESQIWRPAEFDACVLEMGAERKGEIARLLEYVRPDVGVVTAIRQVHVSEGQFSSVGEILAEKWQVAERSRQAVINSEDNLLKTKSSELKKVVTYGVESGIYHWSDLKASSSGYSGIIVINRKRLKARTGIVARHSLYALSAAVAVADLLAVEPENIVNSLATFRAVSGRMSVMPGRHDSLIIDDSYNSSPEAAIAALDTLYTLPKTGRKIAILGSMNELGEHSAEGHRKVGIHAKNLDLLVTIGGDAKQYLASAAQGSGLSEDKIRTFNDPFRAGEFVLANLKKGDQILVKGSQNGVFAEEAVKPLLAHREDRKKLVRQTPAWMERKKRAFGVK